MAKPSKNGHKNPLQKIIDGALRKVHREVKGEEAFHRRKLRRRRSGK